MKNFRLSEKEVKTLSQRFPTPFLVASLDKVEENYSLTTDLWRRVERLNKIITTYAESEFAHAMGRNFIRPPVMRTNALMKTVTSTSATCSGSSSRATRAPATA